MSALFTKSFLIGIVLLFFLIEPVFSGYSEDYAGDYGTGTYVVDSNGVNTGTLYVDSYPQGAYIYFSGYYYGQTPMEFTGLLEGYYDISIEMMGYEPYFESIYITPGAYEIISPQLVDYYGGYDTGTIYIDSSPQDAAIYFETFGGYYYGQTPLEVPFLLEGYYDISIEKAGYGPYFISEYLYSGDYLDIYAQLTPIKGTTSQDITSQDSDFDGILDRNDLCPSRAENFNNYQDTDGCPDELPPQITGTGEKPRDLIREDSNGGTSTNGDLREQLGDKALEMGDCIIDLSTSPSAQVYIDGKLIGQTPVKEKLDCGKYFLKVETEGYAPWEKVVELSMDSPKYEQSITLSIKKEFQLGDFVIEEKYLAIIPILLGITGLIIKLFRS